MNSTYKFRAFNGNWSGFPSLEKSTPKLFSEDYNQKKLKEKEQRKELEELEVLEEAESIQDIRTNDDSTALKVKKIINRLDSEKFGNGEQRSAFTSMVSYLNSLNTPESRKVIRHLGDAMTGYDKPPESKDKSKKEGSVLLRDNMKESFFNTNDDILQGFTFKELIIALQSNERVPISSKQVMKTFDDMMKDQISDATYMVKSEMDTIIEEVNGEYQNDKF